MKALTCVFIAVVAFCSIPVTITEANDTGEPVAITEAYYLEENGEGVYYYCGECDLTWGVLAFFDYAEHMMGERSLYVCPLEHLQYAGVPCGEAFADEDDIFLHVKKDHGL